MAQRQLDHLAQRVDRVAHPAEVVIGDVGAALAVLGGIFGQQLDDRLGVDVDDALGRGRSDDQPQLLQREGRCVEHLPDVVRHVGVDPLVPGGRDGVALGQRPAGEGALQRIGRALQPDIGLGRREDDAGRRLGLRLADLDEVARADAGIGALQAVEPDDVDAFVLAVGADRAGRGRALADDLDHVAFVEPELLHQPARAAGRSRGRCPPGGRLATWTLRDFARSIVSVQAIFCSLPAPLIPDTQRSHSGAVPLRLI